MKCLKCGKELTVMAGDGYTGICKNCKDEVPKSFLYGWICPRCGKVHSPFSTKCDCPPNFRVWTGTTTDLSNPSPQE
jgi:hypothetical protein